jgi:alpha/beta superfamily hydrolase
MPPQLETTHVLDESKAQAQIADLDSRLAVIVTHPWGPLGGNMHNNVVVAAVLYFQSLGVTTLRFDFVGSQIGRGHSQVRQVEEAAQFLLEGKHLASSSTMSPSYILLVGYSYGSLITASASASIPRCIGCISIAPPISVSHWLLCFNSEYHLKRARKRTSLPRLLVLGSRDNFTSEETFMETVTSFSAVTTTGAILKGADHFFAKREKDLMSILGRWLIRTYPACNGDLSKLSRLELEAFTDRSSTSADFDGTVGTLFTCAALDKTSCPGA